MNPGQLDIVFIVIIILAAARVTMTGFISEFFSKAAVIVATLGAFLFYRTVSPYVIKYLGDEGYPDVIAFLIIFLLLYLVIKLLQNLIGSVFQGESMTNLDRALGFFLGLVEGILVVVCILYVLRTQTWIDVSSLTGKSVTAAFFEPYLSDGLTFFSGIHP